MIDPDKPLTLSDLLGDLHLEADFSAWHYGGAENELTIKLKFGDEVITTTTARIEPAGYEREKDTW